MISRRVQVQLLVFAMIALVTVSFLSARYVGLVDKVLGGSYVVTADFAQSGGIFSGAEVTYRGVTVGKVERLRLTDGGVLVDLRMDRGTEVPRDTIAVVENRSAVGEQYVDLQPRRDGAPYLRGGSRIARDDTRTPRRIDTVLLHLDRLVRSVDRKDLATTVDEFGAAFADGGQDLQRLLDNGDALTRSATDALPETIRLIEDGTVVLGTQKASAGSIRSFSTDLADLSDTLRTSDADIRQVLDRGTIASKEVDALLRQNRSGLATLMTNLVTIGQVNVAHLDGIEQILVMYPDVVTGGYTVVPEGEGMAHFGLVLNANDPPACTQGYGGTRHQDPNRTTGLPPLNTSAQCTAPRGSGINVRGAQNAPRPSGAQGSSVPLAVDAAGVRFGAAAGPAPDVTVDHGVPPAGADGAQLWSWMLTGGTR